MESEWIVLFITGKEEIVLSDLSSFLVNHANINFLGLVLTEACKDEMFTDENHPDFSTQIGEIIATLGSNWDSDSELSSVKSQSGISNQI